MQRFEGCPQVLSKSVRVQKWYNNITPDLPSRSLVLSLFCEGCPQAEENRAAPSPYFQLWAENGPSAGSGQGTSPEGIREGCRALAGCHRTSKSCSHELSAAVLACARGDQCAGPQQQLHATCSCPWGHCWICLPRSPRRESERKRSPCSVAGQSRPSCLCCVLALPRTHRLCWQVIQPVRPRKFTIPGDLRGLVCRPTTVKPIQGGLLALARAAALGRDCCSLSLCPSAV